MEEFWLKAIGVAVAMFAAGFAVRRHWVVEDRRKWERFEQAMRAERQEAKKGRATIRQELKGVSVEGKEGQAAIRQELKGVSVEGKEGRAAIRQELKGVSVEGKEGRAAIRQELKGVSVEGKEQWAEMRQESREQWAEMRREVKGVSDEGRKERARILEAIAENRELSKENKVAIEHLREQTSGLAHQVLSLTERMVRIETALDERSSGKALPLKGFRSTRRAVVSRQAVPEDLSEEEDSSDKEDLLDEELPSDG